MAILLQSFMGSLLQTAQIFRNTSVSKNQTSYLFTPVLHWHDPTEARRAVWYQASNFPGVLLSERKKNHNFK